MISTYYLALQLQPQLQPQPPSQPLEGPDCDGSGIADPDSDCNGDGIGNPYPGPPSHGPDKNREGFIFDNPSTNCPYVTQMHIWDAFKSLEKDMSKLFTLIHKNVSFTVMGNHPIAGHYGDLMHFYVNALRRVSVLFFDHADRFEIHPRAIHGGCESSWSVAEVNFRGVMNSGDDFDIVNVWIPQVQMKRSRVACTSCQSRKRKCSGDQPCSTCLQFGVDCQYDLLSRKKRDVRPLRPHPTNSPSVASVVHDDPTPKNHPPPHHDQPAPGDSTGIRLNSREANSGAAFVRRLALKIDPRNAPKLHLFAWNVGIRHPPATLPARSAVPVVETISQDDMRSLTYIFFDKIDPCYGFLDRDSLLRQVSRRWLPPTAESALAFGPYDAVLCGVAALGYLFSRRQATSTELQLAETARLILEQNVLAEPSPSAADLIAGWVLRVAYLRMTASPHATWMASCTLMHLIEATGLHLEPPDPSSAPHPDPIVLGQSIPPSSTSPDEPYPCDPEFRRRLFGMARHLNTWISFELSRSRVVLYGATTLPPTPRPSGYTTEIFNLLPISENLDPSTTQDLPDLEAALTHVLDLIHPQPTLVLAQCNLMLCIYRRLRALHTGIAGDLLDRVLALAAKALRASRDLVASDSPWHQVANVPFQIVSTLVAIDTRASLCLLSDAMRTLREVAAAYNTDVMREAYSTAYLLILLHQRRKEEDTRALRDVLRVNADVSAPPMDWTDRERAPSTHSLADYPGFSWLSDVLIDMPHLSQYDLDTFLDTDVSTPMPSGRM
ncbi:hypothetical protein P168DRAFT_309079 [Aspergillus campestris IBT 28561]|uniref:Zn(2)-C6 fungal-type domain-containing protein n=1 Tax=Aspergillus campestris (strain IBT 28561) TaxID=1392248 RepID=A0A2I1DBK8_ASPC2|nr:uncharacterized protein P168DRAFT_309079 [Aspergillus campestris IBT 28561]PKY07251.1 hypothetical protein P168DRAFT_309079 [Aspergillus campestris IBT 28561]